MTTTRTCTKCGIEKPLLTSFYPVTTARPGTYRRVCAACIRARSLRRRQVKLEAERARDRARTNRIPQRGDARREARIALSTARKSGAIVPQPCEVCGDTNVDGHHDDYTRPLDVRWLCRTHHAEHHRRYA